MVIRKKNYAIIRVYSEASTREAADKIGQKIIGIVYSLAKPVGGINLVHT